MARYAKEVQRALQVEDSVYRVGNMASLKDFKESHGHFCFREIDCFR